MHFSSGTARCDNPDHDSAGVVTVRMVIAFMAAGDGKRYCQMKWHIGFLECFMFYFDDWYPISMKKCDQQLLGPVCLFEG